MVCDENVKDMDKTVTFSVILTDYSQCTVYVTISFIIIHLFSHAYLRHLSYQYMTSLANRL